MNLSTRHALVISLCLHFIVLLLAIFVLRQELERKFVDLLVVDTFSAPKTRIPTPKVKIEPLITTPRQQISKTPHIRPPESRPVDLAEPLRRTASVDLNDHRLKVGGFKARLRRLKEKRLKDGGFRPRAKLPTVGLKPPIGK